MPLRGTHPSRFLDGAATASWPAIMLLLAVVAVAYCNAIPGAWALDDFSSVLENPSIRQLWPPHALLHPPVDSGPAGRPVANASLAVNYAISGLNPWSYRAGNLALHTGAALLLFGVTRRTLRLPGMPAILVDRRDAIALSSAALWAAHPLTTAVVGYVSQRTEALMAFFYLATLYAFLRAAETSSARWKILAPVLCAFGMASKEGMVTAPVFIAAFDIVFLGGSWRETWRARGKRHLALASTWLVLFALALASRLGERGVGYGQGVSAGDYAQLQTLALLNYLKLALWPHPLVFDYGWLESPPVGVVTLAGLGCASILAGTFWLWRKRPRAGFLVASCFLLLLPTTSIVPIVQQPMAESRMYLPLATLVVPAVASLFVLLPRQVLRVALPLIVAALAATTIARNAVYHDEVQLWRDTTAKAPGNARAHANLAAALLRVGSASDARVAATRALALRPDYAEAHCNLALALAATGELAAALEHYDRATHLRPRWSVPHYNRGAALFQLGRAAEAAEAFRAVIDLDPSHARAHTNLAVASRALGRHDDSLHHARRAVDLDPTLPEAHYNLGNAFADAARSADAIQHFTRALELQPNLPRAHNNLGVLFLRQGDRARALRHFDAALALNPDYAEARRNRALLAPP